jgi:EAL domain-containing protein (putative c-di-GMP-specific phosphodiesterase class I)
VLRMSCHALRQLNRQGLRDVRMSVNVSHNQFRNPAFPDTLAAALKDTGVDPSCIELEITESVAMEEPEFVSTLLSRLKKTGVSISIDDFGTGYSSLSQLRVLPVDRLKIDRAFVTGLNETEQSSLIARMVVDLGRSLGLEVIAEGIEFEAEAQALRSLGCMLGQGYLYARPMEMTDLQKWLAHRIPEFTAREDSTDESTAT